MIKDSLLAVQCMGCSVKGRYLCSSCFKELNFFPILTSNSHFPDVNFWYLHQYNSASKSYILNYKEKLQINAGRVIAIAIAVAILKIKESYFNNYTSLLLIAAPSRNVAVRNRGFHPIGLVLNFVSSFLKESFDNIYTPNLLYLSSFSKDSVGLSNKQRFSNIKKHLRLNAYELEKLKHKMSKNHAHNFVRPKETELLTFFIDDVFTSGATCIASLKLLKESGLSIKNLLFFAQ